MSVPEPLVYWAPADGRCVVCGQTYERDDWVSVTFDQNHKAHWVHEHCWTWKVET